MPGNMEVTVSITELLARPQSPGREVRLPSGRLSWPANRGRRACVSLAFLCARDTPHDSLKPVTYSDRALSYQRAVSLMDMKIGKLKSRLIMGTLGPDPDG